jgi:hypothetical protein
MTMPVRTEARLERAFVTAQFGTSSLVNGELHRRPSSVAHAKVMGSIQTFCGLSTLSWFKFWDMSFLTFPGERCAACRMAVAARVQSVGSP